MYVRVFMVLAKKGKGYFSRSGKFFTECSEKLIVVENLGKSQEICFLVADTFQLE